jgi:hypothetical protein
MTTVRLSTVQVTNLIDLLTVTAAVAADDDDRYQLDHCRDQVGELMAPIEVLVLAGALREMTERPGPDAITREGCRRWSAYLARRLSDAPATGVLRLAA